MRKLIIALMMLALCVNLASGALAAEAKLDIPDVAVQPGHTVYVALVLTDSVVGDSMGVTYSYDKEILQALPNSSTWGSAGMLANFSREDSGVWAVDGAKDLKGTVCVLAFQVKSGVTLTETTVSGTVTVKNDAESVGTFSATGRLYAICDHSYGQWQSEGNQLHAHVCTKCGEKRSQSHSWDEGVITDHPTDEKKDLQTFTCTVCGATKETEIPDRNQSTSPIEPTERPTEGPTAPELEYETRPPETEPSATAPTFQYPQHTEPVTVPTAPAPTEETESTNPGSNKDNVITQNPNGNQNNSGSQNNSGNQNHSNGQNNTGNQNRPNNQSNTGNQNNSGNNQTTGNDNHEGHDHGSEGNNQQIVAVTIPEGVEVPENTEPGRETPEATDAPTVPIHDHVHEPVSPEQTGISLAALGAAFAMVAAAAVLTVILIRRMKRK